MKYKRIILLLLSLLSTCFSCKKEEPDIFDDKVPVFKYDKTQLNIELSDGSIETHYMTCGLEEKDLKYLIDKDYDFPLLVFAPGCGTCDIFSSAIEGYIKQTSVLLPSTRLNIYADLKINSLPKLNETAILIFKNGQVTAKYLSSKMSATTSMVTQVMDEECYYQDAKFISDSYIKKNQDVVYPQYFLNDSILHNWKSRFTEQQYYQYDNNGEILKDDDDQPISNYTSIYQFDDTLSIIRRPIGKNDTYVLFINNRDIKYRPIKKKISDQAKAEAKIDYFLYVCIDFETQLKDLNMVAITLASVQTNVKELSGDITCVDYKKVKN